MLALHTGLQAGKIRLPRLSGFRGGWLDAANTYPQSVSPLIRPSSSFMVHADDVIPVDAIHEARDALRESGLRCRMACQAWSRTRH